MKKRTLAVNSFLAVTAMAWLGQPLPAEGRRGSAPLSSFEQLQDAAVALHQWHYQPGERALLRTHLRDFSSSPELALTPGQRLTFRQISVARTLPPRLQSQLQSADEHTVDLIIGHQVVRLHRDSYEVIDVV
jgi:hypothetical protein